MDIEALDRFMKAHNSHRRTTEHQKLLSYQNPNDFCMSSEQL